MKSIASLTSILFVLNCFALNASAQLHDSTSFLIAPTGNFKIGVTEIFITDSSRREKYNNDKSFRELSVKIWYPSDSTYNAEREMYMESIPTEILYNTFKPKGVTKSFLDTLKQYETHSYKSIPISMKQPHLPVLIFSSGYYFGISELYSSLMENLASNGFIVCAISRPYEQPYFKNPNEDAILLNKRKTRLAYLQLLFDDTFRTKKLSTFAQREKATRKTLKKLSRFDKALKLWVADTEFFINYLSSECKKQSFVFSKIDTTKIGVFGHSFGGSVSGQICNIDSRVKAGINIDCFQFGNVIDYPITVPFMLIESYNYPTWNIGNEVIYSYCKSDFYRLSIPNASHFIFSDAAVIPYRNSNDRLNFIRVTDGIPVISTVNSYILDFFNLYLKNKNGIFLDHRVNNSELKFDFNHN